MGSHCCDPLVIALWMGRRFMAFGYDDALWRRGRILVPMVTSRTLRTTLLAAWPLTTCSCGLASSRTDVDASTAGRPVAEGPTATEWFPTTSTALEPTSTVTPLAVPTPTTVPTPREPWRDAYDRVTVLGEDLRGVSSVDEVTQILDLMAQRLKDVADLDDGEVGSLAADLFAPFAALQQEFENASAVDEAFKMLLSKASGICPILDEYVSEGSEVCIGAAAAPDLSVYDERNS